MATLPELVPEVAIEVPECPVSQINKSLLNAIRDFCWQTHYWQHDMEPVTLLPFNAQAPDTYIYTLPVPEDTELLSAVSLIYEGHPLLMKSPAWLDENIYEWRSQAGDPLYYLMMSNKQVRFVPASDKVDPVSVTGTLILQPAKAATEFSDNLMEFDQAIVNGAIARLLLIPKKKWTDVLRASVCEAVYQEGVSRAKFQVLKGFSSGPETIRRRSWL